MQQVNLYLKEFRPKFDAFSARSLLMLSGVVVLFMALWAYFSLSRVSNIQALADAAKTEVQNEEKKLGRLKELGKPGDKTQIEESANQVRTAITNRIYIKQLISNNTLGNDQGFSALMTVLAKSALKDVVLNEFGFYSGGQNIYLHGMSARVDAVPEYIKALQQDDAVAKMNFGTLKLIKAANNLIEFNLGEWDDKKMGSASQLTNQAAQDKQVR